MSIKCILNIVIVITLISKMATAETLIEPEDYAYEISQGVSSGEVLYSVDTCKHYQETYSYIYIDFIDRYFSELDINKTENYNDEIWCVFEYNIIISPMYQQILGGVNLHPLAQKYTTLKDDILREIDVLYFYSNLISLSDARVEANNHLQELYNDLKSSEINNYSINIIDYVPVNYTGSHSAADILNNIKNQDNGFENFNDLINKTNADVFVYISDKFEGRTMGKVNTVAGYDNNSKQRSNGDLSKLNENINGMVILYNNQYKGSVFSHEFGHLLGLGHDVRTNSGYLKGGTYEFSNGMGWETYFDKNSSTIMAYPYFYDGGLCFDWVKGTLLEDSLCNDEMLNYYSNPLIKLCGYDLSQPCGVHKNSENSDSSDSVSAIEVTFRQVADYRYRAHNDYYVLHSDNNDNNILGTNLNDNINMLSGNDVVYTSEGIDNITLGDGSDIFFVKDTVGKTYIHDFDEFDAIGFENNDSYSFNFNAINSDLLITGVNFELYIVDFYKEDQNSKYEIDSIGTVDFLYLKSKNGTEYIRGDDDPNNLYSGSGNHIFFGMGEDDYLLSNGAGINTFYGGFGNDVMGGGYNSTNGRVNYINNSEELTQMLGQTFVGGPGNDRLYGTKFGDTYHYNLGDGIDTIHEEAPHVNEFTTDRIMFGEGIFPEDVTITRDSGNSNIRLKLDPSNYIYLPDFYNSNKQIEEVLFSNGTAWTAQYIMAQGLIYQGTSGNDTYAALSGYDNVLNGSSGNDQLNASGTGNHTFNGNDGNDYLLALGSGVHKFYGGDGNDTLGGGYNRTYGRVNYLNINEDLTQMLGQKFSGGPGTDRIFGTKFGDTYYYNLSDGVDTIYEDAPHVNEFTIDRIIFRDSISPEDVTITRDSGNSNIRLKLDPSNYIYLPDFYNSNKQIEEVLFSNDNAWTAHYIMAQGLIYHGTDGSDRYVPLSGYNNTLYGNDGEDYLLATGTGAHKFYGGNGNDTLGGGYSTTGRVNYINNSEELLQTLGQTFVGGPGTDRLFGTKFGDTYYYNLGDGIDTIYENAPHVNEFTIDRIIFGESISPSNIKIERNSGSLGTNIYLKLDSANYIYLSDFYNSNKQIEEVVFSDGSTWSAQYIIEQGINFEGDDSSNTYSPLSGYNNTLYGYGGNDYLLASGIGVHEFYGGDGNDTLGGGTSTSGRVNYINNGEELTQMLGQTFVGGPGTDRLFGTKFGDTYYYNLGDGIDTIYENAPHVNEFTTDRIIFGEGISPSDVKIERNSGANGRNIYLKLDSTNYIYLSSFYTDNRQIEEVIFSDGTIWTAQYIMEQGLIYHGTDSSDRYAPLSGYNNILQGNNGNDYLLASGTGVHKFDGGAGSDTLGGGTGTSGRVNYINNGKELTQMLGQTFVGGPSSDRLYGTKFGDTYYYNLGDGIDTINENSPHVNEFTIDRIIFGEGISPEDVTIARDSGNSNIRLKLDSKNYIYLSSFYTAERQIEEVLFSDGTIWTAKYIMAQGLIYHGTDGSDRYVPLSGYNNTLYGNKEADYLLATGTGVHKFYGGDGNDTLGGGTGTSGRVNYINNGEELTQMLGQTFVGGKGTDRLYGTKFGDTYYYNDGDGVDTIYENAPHMNEFTVDRLIVNIPTVTFMQEGNNLVLYQGAYIKGNTSNRIVIVSNFYASSNYQIEQFVINGSNIAANDAANQGIYNMKLFAVQ